MKRDISIRWFLPLMLGGLVLIAVVPVMAVSFFAIRDNTGRLLRDKTEMVADTLVERIQTHLDPVSAQIDYLAERVQSGELDPNDRPRFELAIHAALAGTPQVVGMAYIAADGNFTRYVRADWADVRAFASAEYPGSNEALALARRDPARRWMAPVWSPLVEATIIPRVAPLYSGDGFHGVLLGAVRTADLSSFMKRLAEGEDHHPFVLYRGEQVLAHPSLAKAARAPQPAPGEAAVNLAALGDPVLATIWSGPRNRLTALAKLRSTEGHWADGPNGTWAYIYRQLPGYGPEPWTVGAYYSSRETQRERRLVWTVPLAGLGLLIMASGVALRLARRLGTPVVDLAEAAARIEALDLKRLPRFQRGRVAELNRASDAFERMAGALAWFETYLPRVLVRRLMAAGPSAMSGERREVTVMFTDLENYTGFSRDRPADETAAYLNTLLARIGPVIERTGGTIDKYIGDAVMAFWGAPEPRPDHAAACRAACEIAATVTAFNRERRAAGHATCRMRVGLHTGAVVVGNIGFEGRMNYTIIGEVVDAAQRLEQAGKRMIGERDEVVVLISQATRDAAGDGIACEAVPEAMPVYRLRAAT
jgi:class 3 adenylate cyclase